MLIYLLGGWGDTISCSLWCLELVGKLEKLEDVKVLTLIVADL